MSLDEYSIVYHHDLVGPLLYVFLERLKSRMWRLESIEFNLSMDTRVYMHFLEYWNAV